MKFREKNCCQTRKVSKYGSFFTALKNGNNCKILGNCISSTEFTLEVFVEDDFFSKTSMDSHRVVPITEVQGVWWKVAENSSYSVRFIIRIPETLFRIRPFRELSSIRSLLVLALMFRDLQFLEKAEFFPYLRPYVKFKT